MGRLQDCLDDVQGRKSGVVESWPMRSRLCSCGRTFAEGHARLGTGELDDYYFVIGAQVSQEAACMGETGGARPLRLRNIMGSFVLFCLVLFCLCDKL